MLGQISFGFKYLMQLFCHCQRPSFILRKHLHGQLSKLEFSGHGDAGAAERHLPHAGGGLDGQTHDLEEPRLIVCRFYSF